MQIMIASLRYLDTFVKVDGAWLFADRNLILTGARLDRLRRDRSGTAPAP